MKSKIITTLNLILILFFSGIFIWSLWPLPRETQILQPDQAYLEPGLVESCPLLNRLFESRFKLDYPVKLWKSELDEIILTVEPQKHTELSLQDESCRLVIDTRLESSSLSIKPGDRIVVPYSSELLQTIVFNITPYDVVDSAEGRLWISIDVYAGEDAAQDRVPLFVFPFEFKVISVFGLPPILARYICLFALLLQLLIAFRKRLFG